MGLREIAEKDLKFILEDKDTGSGWDIALTSPSGITKPFIGSSNDISQVIDPDTGGIVSGRVATVSIRISSILLAGFTIPKGISDAKSKPWVVEFNDINGGAHKFKVVQANPDYTMGIVTCVLELYK